MAHLPDDALALIALGAEPTPDEARHLQACSTCTAEVDSFSRVVAAGRSFETERHDPPPPAVWAAIHRELELDDSLRADPLAAPEPAQTSPAPVIPLRRPARRKWIPAVAAAAVVVSAAAVGTWGLTRSTDRDPEVLASVELAPLPDYAENGTAVVDRLPDGGRELVVTASGEDARGYREVWLIAPDISGMVSLGTLEGTEGRFRIPDNLNLDEYPIVDISDEPLDGNPAHSGDSILRGQFEL